MSRKPNTKKRLPNHKKPRLAKTLNPTSINTKKLSWDKFLKIVVGLVGLIEFFILFVPNVSIEITGPTNPNDSASMTSVITNNGILPLENVQVLMGIGKIITIDRNQSFMSYKETHEKDSVLSRPKNFNYITIDEWNFDEIKRTNKCSTRLGDLFVLGKKVKLYEAEISILVKYKIFFIPLHCEKEQRFCTEQRSDGKLDWLYY